MIFSIFYFIQQNTGSIHRDNIENRESDINLRMIRSPNCNRSDHLHPLIQCKKKGTPTPSSTSTTTIDSTITNCNKNCRGRRWPKSRHKHKGPTSIEQNDSVAPLLVSNLLDKL